jgi:hypothetical protein
MQSKAYWAFLRPKKICDFRFIHHRGKTIPSYSGLYSTLGDEKYKNGGHLLNEIEFDYNSKPFDRLEGFKFLNILSN